MQFFRFLKKNSGEKTDLVGGCFSPMFLKNMRMVKIATYLEPQINHL